MKIDLSDLVTPATLAAVRTAGLHGLVGVMNGVENLTAPKVAGLIGAKAYVRRKRARLVASGITSLAALRGETLSDKAVTRIRASIYPTTRDD